MHVAMTTVILLGKVLISGMRLNFISLLDHDDSFTRNGTTETLLMEYNGTVCSQIQYTSYLQAISLHDRQCS